MGRYHNWDYKRPFYYMVTLKRLSQLRPLAVLDPNERWGIATDNALTRALQKTIIDFGKNSPSVESIEPFVIMPDHLHLLIKIADTPHHDSLSLVVSILLRLLRNTYQQVTGEEGPVFDKDWHDLIVKKKNQLTHFRNYIRDNPHMALLRQQARDKFHCYRQYHHWRLGETACDLVGNPELLNEPGFMAVRLSRSLKPGSPDWQKTEALYAQWRPQGTAVGTWWSPAEKMAYRHIIANGGNIIFMAPDGFGERWHPAGEEAQRLCAEGRLLFLSPYPPHSAKLPLGETRARCLALNALAKEMANREVRG